MVVVDNSVNGDACFVHYIPVNPNDVRVNTDSFGKSIVRPYTIGDIHPRLNNGACFDDSHSGSSTDSAYGDASRTPSSDLNSARTDSSENTPAESKRNSQISEDSAYQSNPNHKISITQDNDHNDRSPSHSPSSGSLASPETCDETGALLYKSKDIGQGDNIPIVSFKNSPLRQNSSERTRHNSKRDRIRHASYDGPASPRIVGKQEDLDMGNLGNAVEDSDVSSTSSNDSKEESLCGTCVSVCALVVLLFANLLNYMDRYTIAGKTQGSLTHFGR